MRLGRWVVFEAGSMIVSTLAAIHLLTAILAASAAVGAEKPREQAKSDPPGAPVEAKLVAKKERTARPRFKGGFHR